jgi:hypothetical protein
MYDFFAEPQTFVGQKHRSRDQPFEIETGCRKKRLQKKRGVLVFFSITLASF